MTDESLKEILQSENIHIIESNGKWNDIYGYEKSQLKNDLLDYITRLQEENKTLKNKLKSKTELLNKYNEFITELAKSIKQNPEILLKGKVVKSEFERFPYTMNQRLYVVWEFEDRVLESKGVCYKC